MGRVLELSLGKAVEWRVNVMLPNLVEAGAVTVGVWGSGP